MKIDQNKYRIIFMQEAEEQIISYEAALIRIDPNRYQSEEIDCAYRAVHSLKAGADALGFPEIAKYSHAAEQMLDAVRREQKINSRQVDGLVVSVDVLRNLLKCDINKNTPKINIQDAISELVGLLNAEHDEAPSKIPNDLIDLTSLPLAPKHYELTLKPEQDCLKRGIDPLAILIEISELVKVTSVKIDLSKLPSLKELKPDECYVSWRVILETSSPEQIEDIFMCYQGTLEYQLELLKAARIEKSDSAIKLQVPVRKGDSTKFSRFLVQKGVLTSEQALTVLERQKSSRPLMGLLALQSGKLSTEQLFTILSELKPNERFGEAALRFGFLDQLEVLELLATQQELERPLIDCVIQETGIDRNRLVELVDEYISSNDFYQPISELEQDSKLVDDNTAGIQLPDSSCLDSNREMINDFCLESLEHLNGADTHLLIIDSDPTNSDSLNAVYRSFHTIKGVASMLGLTAIQYIAHEAESLLNLAREGKILLQSGSLDLSFETTDAIRKQIEIAKHWLNYGGVFGTDPNANPLLQKLRCEVAKSSTNQSIRSELIPSVSEKIQKAKRNDPATINEVTPQYQAYQYHESQKQSNIITDPKQIDELKKEKRISTAESVITESEKSKVNTEVESANTDKQRQHSQSDNETVRVSKSRLDQLINLIGELVISQSMVQREVEQLTADHGLHSTALPELSKIARDLQELSLSLRMIPLQGTFQRMSRLVRDLNRKIGKNVELKLEGEETELDKSVVDQLADPLMHMVRNAIDHGLETPEQRLAVGKSEIGKLTIRAYYQGGSVHIEIADDGRGLNKERILAKAVEKNLVNDGARLTDSEIYALIFEPGFSTAAAVTDVSGRGVGMDVVRKSVETLQGSIHIRTLQGQGTTFTIRLPLTLAILDGLMIGIGENVLVLPILSVIESFRPSKSDIHTVGGRGEMLKVRGEVIPLIRLYQVLGLPAKVSNPCQGIVVLVEDQGRKYALMVDDLLGQMQAVMKSLDENYQRVEGLAGATILGDGRVALILDINGISRLYANGSGMVNWKTVDATNVVASLI